MHGDVDLFALSGRPSARSLEATGQALDMAISGEGYFVLALGNETGYSRIGSFAVDAEAEDATSARS